MAEASQYLFSYKEVVEALIKQQGIHEGIWGIYMKFSIQGANAAGQEPGEPVLPVAVVPNQQIPGLCDAAIVNPKES